MTITETLSRLPKEILVNEDEQNGKIILNLDKFSFSAEKKIKAGQEDALQAVLRSFNRKYGYEFDRLVFRGPGLAYDYWDSDLKRRNLRKKNYHYYVLSRDYFKHPGVWSMKKLLDIFGGKIFVRLNTEEWKTVEALTGGYFSSRFEDRFSGHKFSYWAYNVQVPFADIVSISFHDKL